MKQINQLMEELSDREMKLAKDPMAAVKYAIKIIGGRWIECEQYIKKDKKAYDLYRLVVLGDTDVLFDPEYKNNMDSEIEYAYAEVKEISESEDWDFISYKESVRDFIADRPYVYNLVNTVADDEELVDNITFEIKLEKSYRKILDFIVNRIIEMAKRNE